MSELNLLPLYVGTYTRKGSDGIYVCHFNPETGELSETRCVAEVSNPTFLAMHPRLPVLYAVCDDSSPDGQGKGQAAAYRIDAVSGELSMIGAETTGPGRPCHVTVDSGGETLLFAEYGGSTAGALPLDKKGSPGPVAAFFDFDHASGVHAARQAAAHAHSINIAPDQQHVYVPDLGGDRIYVFAFDAVTQRLVPADPAWVASVGGAGPRHMAFHAASASACVINELNGTVTVYAMDVQSGSLSVRSRANTLPEGFSGKNTTADLHFSPDGRYLYGSNRGHDSIVVYAYSPENGALTLVQHISTEGGHPRNFILDPSGRFLLVANQDSDTIVVFTRDVDSGRLTDSGHRTTVSMPVCLKWGYAGQAAE